MINKEEILKTITIICSDEKVVTEMKKELAESELNIEPLLNTTIIAVENTLNGAKMQSCTGIDMAHKMLIDEPNKKIILYHVLPIPFIHQKKQNFDIVLAKPNVRILEMPFPVETMVNAFESKNDEVNANSTRSALSEYIKGALSGIFHDIRKAKNPLQPEGEWQTEIVAKGFATAKEIFPMLADKDNAFILRFLEEIAADREEIRKGEEFTGIFCDMEGTLFANGILNDALLTFLHQEEIKGKAITLWTDGNITELQSLLDANGITWQLKAKRDFAGAIVEMAIDDMDENSFTAITKIFAKEFKPVGSISA